MDVKKILNLQQDQDDKTTYQLVYMNGFALDLSYMTNFFREVVLQLYLEEEQLLDFG